MNNALYSLTHNNYVVTTGYYCGYAYVVRSTGNHPCAYIGCEHFARPLDELKCILNVHGGITYNTRQDPILDGLNPELEWIGWDYAHVGDYQMLFEKYPEDYAQERSEAKRYTVPEIMIDIQNVIRLLTLI